MDFNPLMLLAGNLTSIIQGSREKRVRKMQKREGGRDKKDEEGKEWGRGKRKDSSTDALTEFPMCHFCLL